MTKNEFIKHLEEAKRILLEEVDLSVTDYARYKANVCIDAAMDYIKENEEGDW